MAFHIFDDDMFCLKIIKNFVDFLYPPCCALCREFLLPSPGIIQQALCSSCWEKIKFVTRPLCEVCGISLSYDTKICASCYELTSSQNPFSFDQLRFGCYYEGEIVRQLILRLKYQNEPRLALLMAEHLFMVLKEETMFWNDIDIVAPVPLHWMRLLRRQYNQSSLLAKYLVRSFHLMGRFIPDCLVRCTYTRPQEKLSFKARFENIKGSIFVHPKHKEKIKGKTILIVDDVLTSGATVHFCAKELKENGAKVVRVICFAKTRT